MIDPLAYFIVCPLVFLAGLIDSAAGGGGLISLPAYLAGGLPTHLAAGTNKFSAFVGSVSANIAYIKSGNMPWRPALLGVAGALPGAAIGARLLLLVASADWVVRILLLVAVPVVAFLVFRAKDGEMPAPTGWRALPLAGVLLPIVIGFGVGLYDGFFGPGTGTFLALSLRGALGLTWLRATAAAKLVNLSSNLASLTVFLFSGQVVLLLGLASAVFSIAGNLLGARIAVRGGGKAIRVMLIIALTLLLARVVWDLIGGIL